MARPKNFSPELTLEHLADTFIAKGYNGTSLSMLMNASGLSKQSLYDTYGNKQAMYLQAVDCVVNRYDETVQRMQAASNGRMALTIFFEELLESCNSPDPSRSGCIVSGGLLESLEETQIQAFLEQKWRSVHQLLQEVVSRGQQDGSILCQQSAVSLANVFMTLMSGLRVTGRVIEDRQALQQIIHTCFRLLDSK